MSVKSWLVTLAPLIVYLIGFAYSFQSGVHLTPEQTQLLTNLIYAFIGSGAIGAYKSIAAKKV